jgi:AcrR family transcriptional regulator
MSIGSPSLASRHADLTQRIILESAIRLLETAPVTELSVRAVAKAGGMSERTVFRYFATRDEMLDAVALEMSRRLDAPADPTTIDALLDYPQAIFARFEATEALTKAALHSELYNRIRSTDAGRRGAAIRALVDQAAPERPERERKLAAASILYHVIAATWHYYRFYFGFSPEETVAAARAAIAQSLVGLGISSKARDDMS